MARRKSSQRSAVPVTQRVDGAAPGEVLRTLFENSLDGIILGTPDGHVEAANPAACRIFRRSQEEICRLGRTGLVDCADPRLAAFLAERAKRGLIRMSVVEAALETRSAGQGRRLTLSWPDDKTATLR